MFATRFTSSSYETPSSKRLHDAFSQPGNTCSHFFFANSCKKTNKNIYWHETGVYQASLKVTSTGNTDVVGTLFYDDIEYKSANPVHCFSPVIVHYPP